MQLRNTIRQRLDFTLDATEPLREIEESFGREGNPRTGGLVYKTVTFGPYKSADCSDIHTLTETEAESGTIQTAISHSWLIPWDRELSGHQKKVKAREAEKVASLKAESEAIAERKKAEAEAKAAAKAVEAEGAQN